MKSKIMYSVIALVIFSTLNVSAASKAKTISKSSKIVLDFPGSEEMDYYPKWVSAVLKGDRRKISETLNLGDRQIFYFINTGDDLDFLQHWTESVDMPKEIAASLSRVVNREIDAMYHGGSEEAKKDLADKLNVLSKVRIADTVREASFWIQYAVPKNPKQKIKKNLSNAEKYYQYMVVFSMDKKNWDRQVKSALGNPALNAEISEFMLKNAAGLRKDVDSKELIKNIAKRVREPLGGDGTDNLAESVADAEFAEVD